MGRSRRHVDADLLHTGGLVAVSVLILVALIVVALFGPDGDMTRATQTGLLMALSGMGAFWFRGKRS